MGVDSVYRSPIIQAKLHQSKESYQINIKNYLRETTLVDVTTDATTIYSSSTCLFSVTLREEIFANLASIRESFFPK